MYIKDMKDFIILVIFVAVFAACNAFLSEERASEKREERHPEIPNEEYYIGNTGIRNTPTGRIFAYGIYKGSEKFVELKDSASSYIAGFLEDYQEWERQQVPKNLNQKPDSLLLQAPEASAEKYQ